MSETLETVKQKYFLIRKKTFYILFSLCIVALVIYKCGEWLKSDFMPPSIYREHITNGNDTLHFTYYAGGLLGDAHKLIISNQQINGKGDKFMDYNQDSVLVINEELPVFYRFQNNELTLYLNETLNMPKHFKPNIKLNIVDISNNSNQYLRLKTEYQESLKIIDCDGNSLVLPNLY